MYYFGAYFFLFDPLASDGLLQFIFLIFMQVSINQLASEGG